MLLMYQHHTAAGSQFKSYYWTHTIKLHTIDNELITALHLKIIVNLNCPLGICHSLTCNDVTDTVYLLKIDSLTLAVTSNDK